MSSVNKLACIACVAFIKYRAEPDIIMSNFLQFYSHFSLFGCTPFLTS